MLSYLFIAGFCAIVLIIIKYTLKAISIKIITPHWDGIKYLESPSEITQYQKISPFIKFH